MASKGTRSPPPKRPKIRLIWYRLAAKAHQAQDSTYGTRPAQITSSPPIARKRFTTGPTTDTRKSKKTARPKRSQRRNYDDSLDALRYLELFFKFGHPVDEKSAGEASTLKDLNPYGLIMI
jgi:hypothetical protein